MLTFLKTYWFTIILVVLMACGWQDTTDKLHKEQKSHKQDIQLFKDAQIEADTKAQKERKRLEDEAKTEAKQADAKYSTLLTSYRANLVRLKANQSVSSRSDYSEVPPPESGDGPSGGTLIPITPKDADICAVNTARLQVVQEWATHSRE